MLNTFTHYLYTRPQFHVEETINVTP